MKYELDVARNAALKAGEILLSYYHSDYIIDDKGESPMYSGLNPVTDADRASDNYLRKQKILQNVCLRRGYGLLIL